MIAAADRGADAIVAGNDTFSEISSRLHCSHTTARGFVEAAALLLRMPIVGECVARGEVDYANLRMIVTVFGDDASMATLNTLDEGVSRAAVEFTPSALRAQIWKLWLSADPDEAAEVRRRRANTDRRAYIRRGGHGLSWLTACLTDVEGNQAEVLLSEITATVCSNDPRTKAALRADGLMALLHGEAALTCGCGQSDCPKGSQPAPPRRKPLVEVVIDAETLLGLADNPATLADGTPIDPDVARTLAQDATWRAIITDTRHAVAHGTEVGECESDGEPASRTATAGVDAESRTAADEQPFAPDEALAAALADIESSFGTEVSEVPERPPLPAERYLLARGRAQRSGAVLARACGRARRENSPTVTGAAELIEAWADTIVTLPDTIDFDTAGHGGLNDPPPGALIYRPSVDVAALVRATHTTCAFPDCTVASRRCELDHVVAFDHTDPLHGGWTIPANLQPLCKRHHDIKSHRYWTCTTLPGNARHWRHHTGIERITVPCNGFAVGANPQPQPITDSVQSSSDPLTREESLDLLYEPTWWEDHMHPTDHPGNAPDLIAHYREHQAIVRRRTALQPAPF